MMTVPSCKGIVAQLKGDLKATEQILPLDRGFCQEIASAVGDFAPWVVSRSILEPTSRMVLKLSGNIRLVKKFWGNSKNSQKNV